MKTSLRVAYQISAFTFAIAVVAQLAGLVTVPGLSRASLIGGLAAIGLIAFALGDYTRKPSFRIRRTSSSRTEAASDSPASPAAAAIDWTYTTHATRSV